MKFKPYYSNGARTFYGMSTDALPENAVTGDRAYIIDTQADLICYEGTWMLLSSGKSIESKILSGELTVGEEKIPLVLDGTSGTFTVPYGTVVSELLPDFEISEGATISPDTAQDFTDPVVYTVTADEDDYSTTYTITVLVEDEPEA